MGNKVVILGGGIGGMSAAHELIERGFEVDVIEKLPIVGGKARSIPVDAQLNDHGQAAIHGPAIRNYIDKHEYEWRPDTQKPWLPGEHGFRFFPGFYKHIIDTMARIPSEDKTVADNLVDTTEVLFAQFDKHGIVIPARFPRSPEGIKHALQDFYYLLSGQLGIPFDEMEYFASKWWQILTTCEERRLDEYEKIGWWDFIGASERSPNYQKFLARGVTRSLVAAQAHLASARTIGNVNIQLLLGILDPTTPSTDRLLNGPTNEAWLQPWLDYLTDRGVNYYFNATVTDIHCDGGRISDVVVEQDSETTMVRGDYFISALPVERIAPLITEAMAHIDPKLANIKTLSSNVEWMNGIQFYLSRDIPVVHGHSILIDTPWALTAVSQKQFWPNIKLEDFALAEVKGVLSVDISDWTSPGLNGKAAKDCSREEIADEVWMQMKRSFDKDPRRALRDEDLHYWFLDPDIQPDEQNEHQMTDLEPLLVNVTNSWQLRPEASTGIPNFFLASDYVRTYTDLATMEGANEAARRAVNGILDVSRSSHERCQIWPLKEPEIFKPLKEFDRMRWREGLPWDNRLTNSVLGVLKLFQSGVEDIVEQFGLRLPSEYEKHDDASVFSKSGNFFEPRPDELTESLPKIRIVKK